MAFFLWTGIIFWCVAAGGIAAVVAILLRDIVFDLYFLWLIRDHIAYGDRGWFARRWLNIKQFWHFLLSPPIGFKHKETGEFFYHPLFTDREKFEDAE
jgi:hypothetical protein